MAVRKENVQRALDSTDPVAIKEARKVQRQALTRWYNKLVQELEKKDDSGQLDLSLISERLVKEIVMKAKEAYRDLVDLHEHYMVKKVGIVDTDAEDNEYLGKADGDYCEIIRLEDLYGSKTKEKKPTLFFL